MALSAERFIEIAEAFQVIEWHKKHSQVKVFKPYPWQLEFYAAGKTHKQRQIIAGNRVGKSYGAAFEVACHLTGWYPDWWDGWRFDNAITAWCVGTTGEQIRDVIQNILFGRLEPEFTGSMIPPDSIVRIIRAMGTPALAKDIYVEHTSGNQSVCSLKSYTQNISALMGASVDLAWVDEQPGSREYGQILTRTMTGNRGQGGLMMVTQTPELGMNDVLRQWFDDLKPGQWMRTVTWADSPHLDEDTKVQMREAIPEYQREMREFGIPMMGAGLIFDVTPERYTIDPPQIEDWWRVACGIDFGFGHAFAAIWVAHDTETDTMYVFDEYVEEGQLPPIHTAAIRARGPYVPIVYPHDAGTQEKGTGVELGDRYREAGANMVMRFSNPGGGLSVEAGLDEMNQRLQTQRLKISSKCKRLLSEFRQYHRRDDGSGKIVKEFDDAVDACRYAVMTVARVGRPWRERNSGRAKVAVKRKRMI